MSTPTSLDYGGYYHIFNRGVNRQNLFVEERNYSYFLKLYAYHIETVADTYAYCLLPNHFHLLVRIKTPEEAREQTRPAPRSYRVSPPSQAFSNLFNAYTKAVNTAYQRTGSLFERPFHRIQVTSDRYFTQLVVYIHQNPQRHGLVNDFRLWPYSSYPALLSTAPTHLRRADVLAWFGGSDQALDAHYHPDKVQPIKPLLLDDW